MVGWLVGFWCTDFCDLAALINSTPLINSGQCAKLKALYVIDKYVTQSSLTLGIIQIQRIKRDNLYIIHHVKFHNNSAK